MRVEKDFEAFIKSLKKNEVKYLIIGAFAVSYYTRPRSTGDIDFLIKNSKDNIQKVLKALKDFGFGSLDLTVDDFKDDMVIQLGIEPNRIDLLSSIAGVKFDAAYANRTQGHYGKQIANFISMDDLITNKRASNRTKDKSDLELLLQFQNQG